MAFWMGGKGAEALYIYLRDRKGERQIHKKAVPLFVERQSNDCLHFYKVPVIMELFSAIIFGR